MSERQDLIIVDVESTGLDEHTHVPIEVAAVNLRTGEALEFVPFVGADYLGAADGDAMQINRYYERGVYKRTLPGTDTKIRYDQLFDMLRGNRLGGANPRFDAAMIRRGYAIAKLFPAGHYSSFELPAETWHHRLTDVCAYAGGVFRMDPAETPSLSEVCGFVGVENAEQHSALSDAQATAECFRRLQAIDITLHDTKEQNRA
ncbi:exonuclease domain-containing protein [Streptomyces massasporeus]|uniref:3'-5' exonuclease n=1 Tax=Streptomyces massasporeus TaxID=67324 RepID=UPI00364ACFC9